MSQAAAINNITKATNELIFVIKKENALLAAGQSSAIKNVIEEKVDALCKFNAAQSTIDSYLKQGLKFDKDYPPAVKLMELFNTLDQLNQQNDVLIRSNLEVSNIFVEIYKETRAQEALRQFGYNKQGKVSVDGKIEKVMPAIGLNNKV